MERDIYYRNTIDESKQRLFNILIAAGWIIYFISIFISFEFPPKFMYTGTMAQIVLFSFVPAIWMLIGIAEMIRERINKTRNILTKRQLTRGYFSLALGGLTGIAVTAIAWIYYYAKHLSGSTLVLAMMLTGAVLCTVFAGISYRGYEEK